MDSSHIETYTDTRAHTHTLNKRQRLTQVYLNFYFNGSITSDFYFKCILLLWCTHYYDITENREIETESSDFVILCRKKDYFNGIAEGNQVLN